MAHAYRSITARTSASTSPINSTITTVDLDTVLVVMLKVDGAVARAGGALSFAGRTMSQANITQAAPSSPEASAEIWYLLNPPTATSTLNIPNTGALTIYRNVVAGQAQEGMGSALNGTNGGSATSGTNPTPGALTESLNGDIVFAIVASGAQTWAPSAQAGTIIQNTDDGTSGGGTQYSIRTSDGSFTLNWTFGTADDWGAVVAGFTEVASQNQPNNYKFAKCSSAGVISMSERIR